MHIMITRQREQAMTLQQKLEASGWRVSLVPLVECVMLSPAGLEDTLTRFESFDGLLLTSANAVRAFYHHWQVTPGLPNFSSLSSIYEVSCVGRATARQLAAYGVETDRLPAIAHAASLLGSLLQDDVSGRRYLFPCSAEARDVLPVGLEQAGASVARLPLYKMAQRSVDVTTWAEQIEAGLFDVITFTSPSLVRAFVEMFSPAFVERVHGRFVCASIGPTTSEALRAAGLAPKVEAKQPGLDGLVKAIQMWSLDD